jgi:hypothetical protein
MSNSLESPDQINFGPLTNRLRKEAKWSDPYPAWQGYAEECEALLEFIADRNELNRFWPRLCSRKQQRDEALNEIRVAYLLNSIGYPVSEWEPVDAPPRNVEFSVALGSEGSAIALVEVKSPGWEAELTEQERKAGRTTQDKYLDMEVRPATPVGVIRQTVQKARPKFTGSFPSLIVIADDCFVSLGNWGRGPLQLALVTRTIGYGEGLFNNVAYSAIGGVALLWVKSVSPKGVEYASICLENQNANSTAKLPPAMVNRLCTTPSEPLPRVQPNRGVLSL